MHNTIKAFLCYLTCKCFLSGVNVIIIIRLVLRLKVIVLNRGECFSIRSLLCAKWNSECTVQAVITSSSSLRLRWVGRGGLCLCCIWKGWFGFSGRPRQLSARHRKSGFTCFCCLTELSFCRTEPFRLSSSLIPLHFVHIFYSVEHKRSSSKESP